MVSNISSNIQSDYVLQQTVADTELLSISSAMLVFTKLRFQFSHSLVSTQPSLKSTSAVSSKREHFSSSPSVPVNIANSILTFRDPAPPGDWLSEWVSSFLMAHQHIIGCEYCAIIAMKQLFTTTMLRLTINDNCSQQLSNATSFMRLSCGRHLQGVNCQLVEARQTDADGLR